MSVGTSGFSDSSYTVLYLPAVATAFLWTIPKLQIGSFEWEIFGFAFHLEILGILTMLALIGSIQLHALTKAIFGPSGPSQNPKSEATSRRGMVSIILQTPPDEVPEMTSDWEIVGFMMGKYELRDVLHLWKFVPMMTYYLLTTLLIPVYAILILGGEANGFISILIFMALFTFKFRGWVTGPIPSPRPDRESISKLEYERETDSRPRRAS